MKFTLTSKNPYQCNAPCECNDPFPLQTTKVTTLVTIQHLRSMVIVELRTFRILLTSLKDVRRIKIIYIVFDMVYLFYSFYVHFECEYVISMS